MKLATLTIDLLITRNPHDGCNAAINGRKLNTFGSHTLIDFGRLYDRPDIADVDLL